ncbi:MAG: GntR family transcriptional regulator [Pirellulaceae bacterium]|nr:GntR family transcriptional regulator [Pirellulaceae bacterium]
MQIRISVGNPQSIYRQIADQIRRAVVTGELSVGEAIPSVRQLAKELVINPNTVAKAYGELTRDGVLEGQPGRGYIVANRKNIYTKTERLRRLDQVLDSLVSEAITLGFSGDELLERLSKRLEKLLPDQSLP